MSDKDSANPQGTDEAATSESSDKGQGQAGSEQEIVTRKDLEKLEDMLDSMARAIQSNKDRAVKATNERLEVLEGSLKDVLAQAKTSGKSIDDVLYEIEDAEEKKFRKDMSEAIDILKGRAGNSSGGTGEQKGVDVSKVLSELDLDIHDPRVAEFAGKQFESEAKAAIEAAKLVRKITSTMPEESDLPTPPTRRTDNANQQERLMEEYREGSKGLYGKKLINFKMKMIQKGLEIS